MNLKQQRFLDEYLVDFNATQAAIRAGYNPNSANEQAARMLAKDSFKAYVAEKTQSIAKKLGITAEYILGGLKQTAELTAPKRHEANPAAAIKSYELLGKHLRLFEDDDKSKNSQTINIQIVQF